MSQTVRLHRVLRAPPERIYRAFLDDPGATPDTTCVGAMGPPAWAVPAPERRAGRRDARGRDDPSALACDGRFDHGHHDRVAAEAIAARLKPDLIQLHGAETPDRVRAVLDVLDPQDREVLVLGVSRAGVAFPRARTPVRATA